MIRLGLTGYPLSHSLSPKIHAAALRSCGLDGEYSLYPVAPDDLNGIGQLLDKVRTGGIQGLNVSIPHKQNVIPLLDELTSVAQAIGAVNTIYFRNGKLVGENTDAPGFLADLKNFLQSKIENRKSAIVLGAGGSARAVVYALLNNGWQVAISARRLAQAQKLALSFPGFAATSARYEDLGLLTFDLMVNTTPVGMNPDIDSSPLPGGVTFLPRTLVYDLVYNPRETKLVREARAQGLKATTGLGMLIEQAALSFEIWTERKPPRVSLFRAVEMK